MSKSFFHVLLLIQIISVAIIGTKAKTYSCRLDLAFVVDASGAVCDNDPKFNHEVHTSCENWVRLKRFIADVVSRLSISTNEIQVALITFRHSATIQWPLDKFTDKASLLTAIGSIPYEKWGNSNITAGLTTLRNEVFGRSGDRPDAPNKAIVITDGPFPQETTALWQIVDRLHDDGVTTLAVGYSNDISVSDLQVLLRQLSSLPRQIDVTYFKVDVIVSLGDIVDPLTSKLCPSVCSKMDLAFVVDQSGSICDNDPTYNYDTDTTCRNWISILQFIHDIVANLTIGPMDTNVALIIFQTSVTLEWDLTKYQDKASLLSAIQSLTYMYRKGGQTNTTGALQVLDTQVYNIPGDRNDANNTAFIITDGKPTQPETVQAAIDAVHNHGIRTLVVGITYLVDPFTLAQLSSPPHQLNVTYFSAADYHTIDSVRPQLEARICDQATTA